MEIFQATENQYVAIENCACLRILFFTQIQNSVRLAQDVKIHWMRKRNSCLRGYSEIEKTLLLTCIASWKVKLVESLH
jgi:hypothetical protein